MLLYLASGAKLKVGLYRTEAYGSGSAELESYLKRDENSGAKVEEWSEEVMQDVRGRLGVRFNTLSCIGHGSAGLTRKEGFDIADLLREVTQQLQGNYLV